PVEADTYGRFLITWHGIVKPRQGADALVDAIEQLQGAPLPASILETEILPARIDGYDPADLDAVIAAGDIVWGGLEPLGEHDGRLSLYLADRLPLLLPPTIRASEDTPTDTTPGQSRGKRQAPKQDMGDIPAHQPLGARETAILESLRTRGASFFGPLHEAVGGGYPAETVNALWTL